MSECIRPYTTALYSASMYTEKSWSSPRPQFGIHCVTDTRISHCSCSSCGGCRQSRHIPRRYKPRALWLASIWRACQLKVIPKGELKAKPTKRDDDDNTVHTTLHWQTVPSPGVTNVCPRTRQKAAVSRRCDYSFFLAMSQHAARTPLSAAQQVPLESHCHLR